MEKHTPLSCVDCNNLQKSSFTNLSCQELKVLSHKKTCQSFKKGQVLFHEGTTPTGVFCLKEGKVKIYKTGIDGKEQIVRLAKPGDLIGYRSFLGHGAYTASACTLEDSKICLIDRQSFEVTLKQNQTLNESLIQLLTHELRDAENRIRDMAQKSVRERMAEVLLVLKERFGMDVNEPDVLSAQLSRDELANYVGTATESAIRILSELKNDGVIATQGKKIRILNLNKLVSIANLID